MNELQHAAVTAAETATDGHDDYAETAPPRVWHVGPDAVFSYASGRNPFDGMTVTSWDAADVSAGRSE